MVIAAGRLDEVVPLEPAAMPGRVVVQWDKDDCADLGIIKVDLLGLGMLAALEEAIADDPHAREDGGRPRAPAAGRSRGLRHAADAADTVGVFQVESRAQMASLPRNAPQVLLRPGDPGRDHPARARSSAAWCNPFFERRQGRAAGRPTRTRASSRSSKRTLGVPLFQEQLLRIAMVAAGFTGGEAEELRRAMGFKRSMERMDGDRGAPARRA